jgi:hypothetical protein
MRKISEKISVRTKMEKEILVLSPRTHSMKFANIYSYVRWLLVIYDFAADPF